MMDLTRWPRKKVCLVCCVALLVLCLPCALGWSVLGGFHPFGGESTVMDLEDFLNCKMNFINNLDETRRKLYWNK